MGLRSHFCFIEKNISRMNPRSGYKLYALFFVLYALNKYDVVGVCNFHPTLRLLQLRLRASSPGDSEWSFSRI